MVSSDDVYHQHHCLCNHWKGVREHLHRTQCGAVQVFTLIPTKLLGQRQFEDRLDACRGLRVTPFLSLVQS